METEKIICDSDVIIELFDENKKFHSQTEVKINHIGIENILISGVSKMELIKGTHSKEHLQKIQKKLKRLDTILLSPVITLRAIDLLTTYHLSHGLTIPDTMIATTSLETNLKLFTYNLRDFKFIQGLSLYNFN
ncbi:PIN domain-containing protein [Sphingobacterium hungaricum]